VNEKRYFSRINFTAESQIEINAAATKPFGYTPFYPGPGLGWHSILIDEYCQKTEMISRINQGYKVMEF